MLWTGQHKQVKQAQPSLQQQQQAQLTLQQQQ